MLQAVAEGKFNDLDNLITRRIPLEDFVEKGIKALVNEKDEHGVSPHSFPRSFLAPLISRSRFVVKILVYPGKRVVGWGVYSWSLIDVHRSAYECAHGYKRGTSFVALSSFELIMNHETASFISKHMTAFRLSVVTEEPC